MASDQTPSVPAGWYPDPYGAAEMRWWDGHNWTDSVHPPAAPTATSPTPEPVFTPEPEAAATSAPLPLPTPVPTPVTVETPAPPKPSLPVLAPPLPNSLLTDDLLGAPTPAPQPVAPPLERASETATSTPAAVPLVEPPAPQLAAPDLEKALSETPQESAPTGDTDNLAIESQRRLPSRREMRLRNELEAGKIAQDSTPSEFESLKDAEGDSPTEVAARASAVPASTAPAPTTATPSVPDSAAPTAFDWLPGGSAGGFNSTPTALPPTDNSESGFPPLGTPARPTPVSSSGVIDVSGAKPAAPDAWAQATRVTTAPIQNTRLTATRMATVSSWFLALMPLFAGILSVSAVKGQENYPRYIPEFIEWWMLVGGVIVVLYLVTLVLAATDRRKLDWAGYNQPAHWAWALLGAPVYLLVRTISVKRETGRTSILLLVWLLLTAALVGAWFAASSFMPELVAQYTLPFL